MFQKTIDIIKARWPEVAMVVILQAAVLLLFEQVKDLSENGQSQSAMLPVWAGFLLGLGTMLFLIIWQMIYLGFLKTAAVTGRQQQYPIHLFHSGRPYFWRIFLFQILFGSVSFFLNFILILLLAGMFWPEAQMDQVPEWALQCVGLAAAIVLIKPLLLVPAIILVYDVSAIEAVFQMRQFQLWQMASVVKTAIVSFTLVAVIALLSELVQSNTTVHYALNILYYTILSMVLLFLTLMSVLWAQQQYEMEYAQTNEDDE